MCWVHYNIHDLITANGAWCFFYIDQLCFIDDEDD